jgi:transcriptional regulator with PAS, ATPase and Fis domain
VIAATNLASDQLSDERRFRQDLLFRLNTIEIHLPPLRERREDISDLLDHYLGLYSRKYEKPARAIPPGVLQSLLSHNWPGNVRALRHAAERAVILSDGGPLSIDDFSIRRHPGHIPVVTVESAGDLNLERAEKQMIERALQKHSYNISLAANELGLTRASLYRRMV